MILFYVLRPRWLPSGERTWGGGAGAECGSVSCVSYGACPGKVTGRGGLDKLGRWEVRGGGGTYLELR